MPFNRITGAASRGGISGRVEQAIDRHVPSDVRSIVNASAGSRTAGRIGGSPDPNLSAMRSISKQMVQTSFREPWQFRIEVGGAPADWDLYCKEVAQTPIELEAASQRVGAHILSYLNTAQPVSLSLTMRDNEDGRIYDWFADWVDQVVYPDGTWGLPADYLRTLKLFVRRQDGSEYLRQELRVQPMVLGEITESVERSGALLEFPVTLLEFRGSGLRY